MRLNKKEVEALTPQLLKEASGTSLGNDILEDLRECKKIEEEFDIDLVIWFKALKHGVFYRDFRGDSIKHTNNLILERFNGKKFCLSNKNHCFIKEDYGNGKYNAWALTKEELL